MSTRCSRRIRQGLDTKKLCNGPPKSKNNVAAHGWSYCLLLRVRKVQLQRAAKPLRAIEVGAEGSRNQEDTVDGQTIKRPGLGV